MGDPFFLGMPFQEGAETIKRLDQNVSLCAVPDAEVLRCVEEVPRAEEHALFLEETRAHLPRVHLKAVPRK